MLRHAMSHHPFVKHVSKLYPTLLPAWVTNCHAMTAYFHATHMPIKSMDQVGVWYVLLQPRADSCGDML